MSATEPASPSGQPLAEFPLEEVRSTAKWVLGVAAAVAGVFLAGVELTGLAEVLSSGGLAHKLAALGGLIGGLGVTAWVVSAALQVLKLRRWSPTDVRRQWIEQRTGNKPRGDKGHALTEVAAAQQDLIRWRRADSSRPEPVELIDLWNEFNDEVVRLLNEENDASNAERRLAQVQADLKRVVGYATYSEADRAFNRLVRRLWQGLLFGAVAWTAFTWGTLAGSANESAAVEEPVPVRVFFAEGGLQGAGFAGSCASAILDAVAIGGTLAHPFVVSEDVEGCPPLRFTVSDDIGIAVPQ